jgi:hypothetical protein
MHNLHENYSYESERKSDVSLFTQWVSLFALAKTRQGFDSEHRFLIGFFGSGQIAGHLTRKAD